MLSMSSFENIRFSHNLDPVHAQSMVAVKAKLKTPSLVAMKIVLSFQITDLDGLNGRNGI